MSVQVPEFKFALREDLKHQDGFFPSKADPDATGWDVRCAEPDGIDLHNKEYHLIRLGFRMFCPKGWWVELRPRSSSFAKKQLHALYGVIDENYEREVRFAFQYVAHQSHGPTCDIYIPPPRIAFGERIGQLIPVRRQGMITSGVSNEEFDSLCAERQGTRGTGGFGSTG